MHGLVILAPASDGKARAVACLRGIAYNCVMKRFFFMLTILALLPGGARAQEAAVPSLDTPAILQAPTGAAGEVGQVPQCFNVINKAPYTVLGTVVTDYYTRPDGVKARHRSNFNLKTGEQTRFCTQGPYYEGGKLELVLRTLVPVFDCKTRVDADIIINGRIKPEGGTDSWAVCR